MFELVLAPGAGVPDLVAAAGTLPRGVVYTGHRRAAPGDDAAVLLFHVPPPGSAEVPVRQPVDSGPSPVPASGRVPDTVPGPPGWVPDVDAVRACSVPSVLEDALSALLTPAAFSLHGHLLVHGLAHCDPEALVEAAELARRRRTAHQSATVAA